MATVNLGSIKFKWKGTYAGGTAYTIDDVVSYNGSSYICIQASTGNLPTDTAYFEQMSQKGTDGTNGTDGTDLGTTLTTQGDIVYRDGSGLARLGAGTSGQALITGGTGANPSWGDVSGGLIQTVQSKSHTATSIGTANTFIRIPATEINITTQQSGSKIFVHMSIGGEIDSAPGNIIMGLQYKIGSGGTWSDAMDGDAIIENGTVSINGSMGHNLMFVHTHGQSVGTQIYYSMVLSNSAGVSDYELNQQNIAGTPSGFLEAGISILQEIA